MTKIMRMMIKADGGDRIRDFALLYADPAR